MKTCSSMKSMMLHKIKHKHSGSERYLRKTELFNFSLRFWHQLGRIPTFSQCDFSKSKKILLNNTNNSVGHRLILVNTGTTLTCPWTVLKASSSAGTLPCHGNRGMMLSKMAVSVALPCSDWAAHVSKLLQIEESLNRPRKVSKLLSVNVDISTSFWNGIFLLISVRHKATQLTSLPVICIGTRTKSPITTKNEDVQQLTETDGARLMEPQRALTKTSIMY